jgi:hypothetical protein
MNRREFLVNSSLTCGLFLLPGVMSQNALAGLLNNGKLFDIPRPIDTKLNIKPLYGVRIPDELHEGPCRPNDPASWDKSEEKKKARQAYQRWEKELRDAITDNVNILDPIYVEYAGDHRIDQQTWKEITARDKETDLYVLSHYRIPGLGYHTEKPIAVVGNACATLDVPARLKAQGETAYGVLNYDHLNRLIACLKVKKALYRTKLMVVSNGNWDYEYNVVRSNIPTNMLKEKFDIDSHFLSIREMMDEYEKVKQDKAFLRESERITQHLVQHAEKNTMKSKDIQLSVLYYLTVKKLMDRHGCNAFTATCQEFCVSKLPMKYKVTPCLTHSLLKDEGLISVCEGDTNVFLSMALQMYLANRSAYMGNTLIHNLDQNLLAIHHDVPGRKMYGLDKPEMPYRIVGFTERNWGATIRYDFSRDKGKAVTFCRLTPEADKILMVKGEMRDVEGLNRWGCSLRAIVKVSDAMKYFREAQDTGHHFSMVYGDFIPEMKMLADILKLEMVAVT